MINIAIDILPGELADRMSILDLRLRHLPQHAQRQQVETELHTLRQKWQSLPQEAGDVPRLVEELGSVNAQLWDVEDQLRLHEGRSDFGFAFVELARSVYRLNDRRSQLKRQINLNLCGMPGEEKVHPAASPAASP